MTYDGTNARFYIDGSLDSTSGTYQPGFSTGQTHYVGAYDGGTYFSGIIDEVIASNVVRTADEIAEAYRAGRDHRISKTISSTDLSGKTKLPFYVASDRTGTWAELSSGESAYANYEPDANTTGLYHLDEQAGTANTYIKDSSGNGYSSTTITGTTFVQGKIGKARNFDGTDDYVSYGNVLSGQYSSGLSVEAWINTTSTATNKAIVGRYWDNGAWVIRLDASTAGKVAFATCNGSCASINTTTSVSSINDGKWHHIIGTLAKDSSQKIYIDGVLEATVTPTNGTWTDANYFCVGTFCNSSGTPQAGYFPGSIDEVRFSNIARTPDEIRQAYEVGKRTHQITNDFVTSPQAAYSSGTSVTINNPYGTTNLTDTLSIGETIIFKENVGGTETVSQAVVTAIINTSSVYGTVTLLAAPSFPSGGYTTNATVFKWQREFFDITGILGSPGSSNSPQNPLNSSKDAISRITLRVTDGSQGANVWIDDIKAAGPYLTQSTTRTASVTSTPRQYMQYRIIFSTTDPQVSPTVTSVSVQTHSSPVKVVGSDTLGADGSFDKDGNLHLGSNNVKKVAFYDRTKDQISYALDFDGSNDYVGVTDNSSLRPSNITVEAWINTPTVTPTFQGIVIKGWAAAGSWLLYLNNDSVQFGVTNSVPTQFNAIYPDIIETGKWYHVVGTFDGTTVKVYVNGVIGTTTATVSGSGFLSSTADVAFPNSAPDRYTGMLDEVAIFSTARTAAQIQTDYNARRLSDTTTGLVGLWHFDEGQGTRAYDSSGNNNHGTLTNMAATAWVNSQNDRDQSALSQQVLGIDPNWASGPVRASYAMSFDGTGDYLTTSGSSTTASFGTGDFSVEAWIYPTTASGDKTIASVHDGTGWLLKLEAINNKVYAYSPRKTNSPPLVV